MGTLEEDALFWEKNMPFLTELPRNVQDIWYYAFTEIMNNAIDHSAGEQITFAIQKDALYTEISIADEVFRVFQNMHPDIKLTVINANASVLGMIRHVKREEKPAG